jgi:hypothetical protein
MLGGSPRPPVQVQTPQNHHVRGGWRHSVNNKKSRTDSVLNISLFLVVLARCDGAAVADELHCPSRPRSIAYVLDRTDAGGVCLQHAPACRGLLPSTSSVRTWIRSW